MKTKNKTILMFILILTGITLCYSQGWADGSSVLPGEIFFTCTNQGPAADKTVEVQVRYVKVDVSYNKYIWKPKEVLAVDKTDPKNPQELKPRSVSQHYFFMKDKNGPRIRAFPGVNTGPPQGGIICSIKNYPVFVWGGQAWFIYK